MWLQDLTKALYYLNSMIGNYLLVESVKDGECFTTLTWRPGGPAKCTKETIF